MTRRLAAVPDQPRKGLALIRVSKAKGREDLTSPELQRTAITDYAARNGIEVVEWVEALDESASRVKSAWWARLDQAVGQVEQGERDVVLVWKFSRAARQRRRWAVALDRIEVAGGTLESATEGLDLTTSTGRLARGMLAELAAWEAEVKGEQWKETHDRRRSAGLPHDGAPRFGYTYTKHEGHQPCPDQGPILAGLYRRYAAGEGFRALVLHLNSLGVPTQRGGAWTIGTVARILDHGFAAGLIHSRGELLPGAHPPIITEQEWADYQQARDARRLLAPRVKNPTYVLAGLIRCECGSAMQCGSMGARKGYQYRCRRYATTGECEGTSVTRARAEQAVREWVRVEASAKVSERAATLTARKAAAVTSQADSDRLSREYVTLEKAIGQLTVDKAMGVVPERAYRTALAQMEARQSEILAAQERIAETLRALSTPRASILKGLDADWDTLSVHRRREMLALVMQHVLVERTLGESGSSVTVVEHG